MVKRFKYSKKSHFYLTNPDLLFAVLQSSYLSLKAKGLFFLMNGFKWTLPELIEKCSDTEPSILKALKELWYFNLLSVREVK